MREKKYEVNFKEVRYFTVTIKAQSGAEAKDIASRRKKIKLLDSSTRKWIQSVYLIK